MIFTATWCGPCRVAQLALEKIEMEVDPRKAQFGVVDIDQDSGVVWEEGIYSVTFRPCRLQVAAETACKVPTFRTYAVSKGEQGKSYVELLGGDQRALRVRPVRTSAIQGSCWLTYLYQKFIDQSF